MRQAIITFDDGERVLIALPALTSKQLKYPDLTERQIVEGFNLALAPGGHKVVKAHLLRK